jgi:hypothetical protein
VLVCVLRVGVGSAQGQGSCSGSRGTGMCWCAFSVIWCWCLFCWCWWSVYLAMLASESGCDCDVTNRRVRHQSIELCDQQKVVGVCMCVASWSGWSGCLLHFCGYFVCVCICRCVPGQRPLLYLRSYHF